MKIKTDYVTNSSSASFIIGKCNLTDFQIALIRNHLSVGMLFWDEEERKYYPNKYDEWVIVENDKWVEGYTSMDNFDMNWFLTHIVGVKEYQLQNDTAFYEKTGHYGMSKEFKKSYRQLWDRENSPCRECLVQSSCEKSQINGTICDKFKNFIESEILKLRG